MSWLTESNRMRHLYAGTILLVLWVLLGVITSLSEIQITVTGLAAVFIAMCSAEYKDKSHGGMWDWLDVLAGVLVPIAALVFVLIFIWK